MQKRTKQLLSLALFICLIALSGNILRKSYSASLTSTSVTLSNARLSFKGGLASGNTVGTSQVVIDTTAGNYPSTSSAQLVEGDTVLIGEGGSLGSYTVASTSSESTFTITGTLASGDADANDDVIATNSATLTVRFTTVSAVNNGIFRFLVPAESDDGVAADGIPDSGYWDYTTGTPTVTCPSDITNYTFSSSTATASAVTIDGTDYHAFACPYTGTGAVGSAFDGTTNDYVTIASLINPAPESNHTTGTADTHKIIIQHLDESDDIVDQTTVSVGVIEAVKVTATVPPQISFRILGKSSGSSVCGGTTGVTTTAAAVPFGEIAIDSFTLASQSLIVSTNASGGYAVTASENDQLGMDGTACAGVNGSGLTNCIQDANVASMDSSTSQDWTTTSEKGFGYSMDNESVATIATFEYDDAASSFLARHFADEAGSESAVQIMSYADPADNHFLDMCYRIIASSTTEAGYYENYIEYTATATF